MKNVNLKFGLIALAGIGFSVNVSAADLTCSDLTFSPEAYAAYEFVDKACLEVVDRDGGTYAKMTARIVAQTSSGTHIRFHHSDGTRGPNHKSKLPKNFMTRIAGKDIKLKDLAVRQDMNIYVSEQFWVPTVVLEEAIVEEIIEEAIVEEIIEEVIEEELEAELPTTAGPLPWLALFGSLFLILGGALRLSRKQ
jgi:hypothetical protein